MESLEHKQVLQKYKLRVIVNCKSIIIIQILKIITF